MSEKASPRRSPAAGVLLLLLGLLLGAGGARAQCSPAAAEQGIRQERQNKLAMYKVTLRTYWSRARFPRHYPEWRPPAQFGKLVGRTHDPSYALYRLGQRLSAGARQYVETGRTDGLDTGADFPNTLHSFTGPAVPQGEGTSVARAFLDGNHTLVSVFARINPSPDWFVGVDSFQLCVEGNWVDSVTVELDPLDGGTDNGFTFTAANWPTQPQGIAYRITSRYPAHPAGSFYYPNLPRLPPIALLTFAKVLGYSDKELANLILGDVTSILPQVNTLLGNLNKVLNGLKPIDFGIRKRYRIQQLQEDVNAKTGKPNIKTCNDTLNSYVQSVEHGFQKMVRTKLGEQRDKISKLVSTLNTLKPKLEACKNEGKDCGDLNKLNRDMFDYKNFLRDHTDLGSSNVAQIYAGYYVTSEMLEKDEMKVITPVKNCLKTIK